MDLGVAIAFVLTAIGCCMLACSVFGWCVRDLNTVERIVLAIACIAALCNHILIAGLAGCAAIAALVVYFVLTNKSKKEAASI